MAKAVPAAGMPAATTYPRWRATGGGGWADAPDGRTLERERLETRARLTDATGQLLRCFPCWTRALEQLTSRALERLAANEPLDPNDPDAWRSRDAHAQAVLHRHGEGTLSATRLTSAAITALIDGQAAADRAAGLDWSAVTTPASTLDERLARAHATLPIDLDDPGVWAYQLDQRRVLAGPLGLDDDLADDLSRWLLANPGQFDAGDLRCWRIGSDTWLSLAGERLGAVGRVERPVGVFVVPAIGSSDGWQLTPVLALDTIRLIAELGGWLERDLRSAVIPIGSRDALLERINIHTLHVGPRECLDSAGQLAQELSRELGTPISPGVPRDKRERWGRLAVRRRSHKKASGAATAELELRVCTFPARGFSQRRLGSAPREEQYGHPSAVMDLGEAVQTAVDAGLPLLLSTEAAGQLKDTVRVGRMKGRPGMLTITTSDGVSASTRRVVAEQALGELRALKRARANVTLSAGARQVVRMTLARAAGRRPGAARPPARDGGAEGRRLRRRRLRGRDGEDDQLRPGARAPRLDAAAVPRARRRRGTAARPVARGARPAARPGAGCRRWRPTSSCCGLPTTGRSPGRSGASTASSATGRASCWWPTACSIATRPTCRRSRGTC